MIVFLKVGYSGGRFILNFKDNYKRLCSGWHIFYRYTLWMGKDHLLHIATGIFVEEYRRFYFRDIQSLIVHKSNSWLVWNFVLLFLAFVSAMIAVAFSDIARMVAGMMAILLIMFVLISFIRGPGCVCYIQTAVQTQKLRSISRLNKAQKIMDFLKPIIIESQQESEHEYQSTAML